MSSEDLLDFVKSMSKEGANKMEMEKITPDLVHLMSDEELKKYLPVHGDRLRLRQHLKNDDQSKRKNKLLTVLHRKIDKAKKIKHQREYSSSEDEDDMRRAYGNRNAVKGTRYVEVGWIHKVHQRTKQVRSKTGGGTRKVCMRKDATRKDIMEEARQLFFPDGESKKGKLEDFNYDMWDFSERKLKSDVTIQKMYEETKMPMLRFYLATWDKNKDEDAVAHTPNKNQDNVINTNPSEDKDTTVAPKLPLLDMDVLEVDECTDIVSAALQISGIATEVIIDDYDDLPDPGFNLQMETDFITLTNPEVATNKQDVHTEVTVRVHRGHVLLDMIRAFKSIDPYNDIISFEMIMPNGCIEIAEDDGGVTRDSLTEFWKDFYEQCTEGTSEKVPFLRHDFGEEEWRAVAKIVVFGWARQGYFPIQLSLPFMQQCIFGFYSADLLEGFYKVLPEHERVCLQMALSDFTKVDEDDLMDILDAHGVRHLPNQLNIARIVMEIAHKEIIQTPMFVSDCWHGLMGGIKLTEEELVNLYAELKPTPKAVCKRLCFPCEMKPDETVVSHHLKRFIRELNEDKLGRFVRFCTGSDLLISKKISIEFVNVSGLARRPVSHTCNSMLELPKTYDNFPEFRAEFVSVLESNVWVMDIV